eukprot:GAHX01002522.1.p1 GENE.GAHX01002522.1~~GAHX01002522.1.p1  ORF type:complete len:316 (-),score=19.95 GAHX01002522.1:984-1931(-)
MFYKIKDDKLRHKIDKRFEELTKIHDHQEFKRKLLLFERYTRRLCPNFSEYFIRYYSAHYDRWCLSTRLESVVNTNMFVEAFFGVFKKTYLRDKSKNRLDFLYNALLTFEAHKNVTMLRQEVSNQKQFMGYRARIADNKHILGNTIDSSKFKFQSQSGSFIYKAYEIRNGACMDCSVNCKYICHKCKICASRYSCSCLSYTMKKECCKHIHIAHSLFQELKDHTTTSEDSNSHTSSITSTDIVSSFGHGIDTRNDSMRTFYEVELQVDKIDNTTISEDEHNTEKQSKGRLKLGEVNVKNKTCGDTDTTLFPLKWI